MLISSLVLTWLSSTLNQYAINLYLYNILVRYMQTVKDYVTFKVIGLPIFWIYAYLMKVISD